MGVSLSRERGASNCHGGQSLALALLNREPANVFCSSPVADDVNARGTGS